MRDSELYYGLFPYRSGDPKNIINATRHEVFRPLALLDGVAKILDIYLKKSPNASPTIISIQKELTQVQESIYSLLVRYSKNDYLGLNNPVMALREEILPYINQAQNIGSRFRACENEVGPTLKDSDVWIEYVERASHEIWVIVDVLTNPDLELPNYLSEWLSIRDEMNLQAQQGNIEILGTLIAALDNPEPKIRIDSLICLGHLKNAQSISFVAKLLNDEFDDVKVWAVECLKKIDELEARLILKAFYDSQNKNVK